MTPRVLAVDLGATSGRVVAATIAAGGVQMEVVSRFPNGPTAEGEELRWDMTGLFQRVKEGLRSVVDSEMTVASIGIDSWAVDYGRLRDGVLVAEPRHYRNPRTSRGVDAVHSVIPHAELYARNGLQFLPFNTVYQLASDRLSGELDTVDTLLMIPDLLAFWLTGQQFCEETNASTTGLLPCGSRHWDSDLLTRLGIDERLLPALIGPGEQIGQLNPAKIGGTAASSSIPVIAVGSHDTASAVAAVPMDPTSSVYLSCGTWGLVGVEKAHAILTEEARRANFTNERGVDGTIRFLRNEMGLWLLSECVREWEDTGSPVDLPELLRAADRCARPDSLLDVTDPELALPGDMIDRIATQRAAHGLPMPASPAELTRLIVESLAARFAGTAHQAADLAGIQLETIHLVGGGAQNLLLCQLVADYAECPVVAGPVEATAMGNVLVQARAVGLVAGGLPELRTLVGRSTSPRTHLPRPR